MGRALYRKYRSKKLAEIVGQEHVTTALSNALKNGHLSHAYLFTGPRGTGKTSIARILAHEVNGLPYDETATHLDIIEIDAASNRRIDEIRTLRERVHNAPTSAKYKVYIIDEVHMLTKEAFNALLKTLEEPPEHVIFILATTEAHKLPETIISRTQRYTFKPAEQGTAAKLLGSIAKSEGMDITPEALELVATHGRGSFRDSISLLDQVSNTGSKIGLDEVRRSLGIAPDKAIQDIVTTLASGSAADLLARLKDLHEQGYQAPQLAKQLGQKLRSHLLEDGPLALNPRVSSQLMQKLIDVPAAHDPLALLEIILLDVVLARKETAPTPPMPKLEAPLPSQKEPPATSTKPTDPPLQNLPESAPSEPEKAPAAKPVPQPKASGTPSVLDEASWQQVLHTMKQQHNTLYGIARMAVPLFDGDKLTLSFSFPFHQKRFNEAKNKQILSDIIAKDLGLTTEIICIVDKGNKAPSAATSQSAKTTDSASPLDTISNIFGGAEVLE
jgi:DNA polymerase III subunit gamma/tau